MTSIRVMSRTNENTALRRWRRSLEKPRLLRRQASHAPPPVPTTPGTTAAGVKVMTF